jgi:metal-sulfur cluster biosynthetic enzyme
VAAYVISPFIMALTKEDVVSALRTCVDPEIPINIVDLGLVYEVDLSESPTAAPASDVTVRMTLTSTGCPMSHSISKDVNKALRELPGIGATKVEIVWEPVWRPEMITSEGRKSLNLA